MTDEKELIEKIARELYLMDTLAADDRAEFGEECVQTEYWDIFRRRAIFLISAIDLPSIKAAARAEALEESDAVKDVKAERRRQIEAEGWDAEHDARHAAGDLADAAACYAATDKDLRYGVPFGWPWGDNWWKPTTRRRDLVKAGALILAEIERLDSAALAKAPE
ncbi:MAG: hypothetical protein WC683_18370 [bacterium]